jgi:hypothetical protein
MLSLHHWKKLPVYGHQLVSGFPILHVKYDKLRPVGPHSDKVLGPVGPELFITATIRKHLVLFGMQIGTCGPYLAAMHSMRVSVMLVARPEPREYSVRSMALHHYLIKSKDEFEVCLPARGGRADGRTDSLSDSSAKRRTEGQTVAQNDRWTDRHAFRQ